MQYFRSLIFPRYSEMTGRLVFATYILKNQSHDKNYIADAYALSEEYEIPTVQTLSSYRQAKRWARKTIKQLMKLQKEKLND